MSIYENVFMTRQDLTETQVEKLTAEFSKIIEDHKGKILKTEYWGLRTLAYPINKAKKAHYTLIEFEVDGNTIQELERLMRLNEDVVRYLTTKQDAPSEGPSVMMKKSYDSDDSNRSKPDTKKEAA